MPATATGRGAQVVLDPLSDTVKAVRGAYAPTLEGNTGKVAADIAAGIVSSGYRPDGTTSTGGVAADPDVNPSNATDTFAGGISLGSTYASGTADLSKHISLYSGLAAGFNVTSGNVNYQAPGAHTFWLGTTALLQLVANSMTLYVPIITFSTLPGNYANDAAAQAGGVPVGGTYRNGSVLMVRAV